MAATKTAIVVTRGDKPPFIELLATVSWNVDTRPGDPPAEYADRPHIGRLILGADTYLYAATYADGVTDDTPSPRRYHVTVTGPDGVAIKLTNGAGVRRQGCYRVAQPHAKALAVAWVAKSYPGADLSAPMPLAAARAYL